MGCTGGIFMPKRKYRKERKGRNTGYQTRGCNLEYGEIALRSQGHDRISENEIDAARLAANRCLKEAKVAAVLRQRIYPDVPVTSKPKDVRMGSGKGNPAYHIFRVKPGRILFEIDGVGVSENLGKDVLMR